MTPISYKGGDLRDRSKGDEGVPARGASRSRAYFEEILYVDIYDGELRWKSRPASMFRSRAECDLWNRRYADQIAGSVHWSSRPNHPPYKYVRLEGRRHAVHRIVFCLVNGYFCEKVDHEDGDTLNNNPHNLREATNSQNQANRRRKRTNTSGLKGVSWYGRHGKWSAAIRVNGKDHWLGLHPTKGLAAVAYAKAAIRFFGQYARI